MADLNNFNGTAQVLVPFEKFVDEDGLEYAKAKLRIHNYQNFYVEPWLVIEGRKIEQALTLAEGQYIKIRNASLRSVNRTLKHTVKQRVLNPLGKLEVIDRHFEKGYTDVHLFIDDRDGSDIIPTNELGEHDINSFCFTGRICTEPQSKIVGRNKNSLSFVSASNFAKKDRDPAFLYVVVEGNEASRLEGRLGINSKFSGNAILRTKGKHYVFEYEDTVIDQLASQRDGLMRYTSETKSTEVEVEQLEVLFLDYVCQLNFIDNIKNPDLAEQFGEV